MTLQSHRDKTIATFNKFLNIYKPLNQSRGILKEKSRRPTWLDLISLFFSNRMIILWKKIAAGIITGLILDSLTGNLDYTFLDRL